jgi:hypothetical protein
MAAPHRRRAAHSLCSDGRRGIVIATRDESGTSGAGTVRMDDGEEFTFMFGRAAAAF